MHPLDNEALKLGAKAVRRRRLDAENRQDFISLLGRIVVILLCAWVLFTQVFLLTQAKGSSMFPAVKDGDLLICYRLQKTYAKNDVVVYTQGGKLRVGRILGREGDLVALDDSGTLVVNGAVQSGEILYPTYASTPTRCRRAAFLCWAITAHNPRTAGTLARFRWRMCKQK